MAGPEQNTRSTAFSTIGSRQFAVQRVGLRAQFEHVAEHGDAPSARTDLARPSKASAARMETGLAL